MSGRSRRAGTAGSRASGRRRSRRRPSPHARESRGRRRSSRTLLMTVGLPNRPEIGGQRRLRAHLPAFALKAFEQRSLFAADIGAGAKPRLDVEGVARAEHLGAEEARRRGPARSRGKRRRRRADIRSGCRHSPSSRRSATAAIAMPSMSRNGSPSISIRSAKVPLSPSSALQTTYFWSAGAPATVRHLIPSGSRRRRARAGRTRAPPRSSPPDRAEGRGASPAEPAIAPVVVKRKRVDDAAAGEEEPRCCLARYGMSSTRPSAFGGPPPARNPASNSGAASSGAKRPVAEPACRRLDLDQRLQPEKAARARSHDAIGRDRAAGPRRR